MTSPLARDHFELNTRPNLVQLNKAYYECNAVLPNTALSIYCNACNTVLICLHREFYNNLFSTAECITNLIPRKIVLCNLSNHEYGLCQ